jgi:TRAP-type C4-dicarboxylate transport system permease small subunit
MQGFKPYVHHVLVLIIGALLITAGAQAVSEHFNAYALDADAQWYAPVILIAFGGMLSGVAINKLFHVFRVQKKVGRSNAK